MDCSDTVDKLSILDQQVQTAKLEYIQAVEALCQRVEEAKRTYHRATDENRQSAQERYIKILNDFNSLVAVGGAPKHFEAAQPLAIAALPNDSDLT